MWSRRRERLEDVELLPAPDESVRVLGRAEPVRPGGNAAFSAASAVARIERFVGAANANIMQLEDRIAQLETVTHELTEGLHARPTHHDLLDVRLTAARIDAELRRVATELRAEIAEIKETADGTVDARSVRERRLASLAEELLDLAKPGEAS
jgi:chromosome segregation ATPase